jgi:hypothetical protein
MAEAVVTVAEAVVTVAEAVMAAAIAEAMLDCRDE